MEYPRIIQLLLKRRKDGLSGKERKELEGWLEGRPAHRREAELYDKIWNLSGQYKAGYEPDTKAGLERFRRRVQTEQPTGRSLLRWWWLLLLIALLAALGWYLWQRLQPAPPSAPVAVVTGAGEQRVLDLPDGSRVFVNENSRLSYTAEWLAGEPREIQLEGEAFFEVQDQPGASFLVRTPETEIEVLGTAFNVRAYRTEPETAVTVEKGRVAFRTHDRQQSLNLATDDKGICEHGGRMYPIQDAGVNARPWHSGVLRFRKTPMSEVARSLQQYFGLVLDLEASNIAECSFTYPPLRKNETDQLKQTLEAVYQVRIEQLAEDTLRVFGGKACRE